MELTAVQETGDPAATAPSPTGIEILIDHRRVRVHPGFSHELLSEVTQVLEGSGMIKLPSLALLDQNTPGRIWLATEPTNIRTTCSVLRSPAVSRRPRDTSRPRLPRPMIPGACNAQ